MYTGIGRSPGTSYFRIAAQLTGEELSYLRRTRDLADGEVLDSEVLPVIKPIAPSDVQRHAMRRWPLAGQSEARVRRLPAARSCVTSEPAGSGNGR